MRSRDCGRFSCVVVFVADGASVLKLFPWDCLCNIPAKVLQHAIDKGDQIRVSSSWCSCESQLNEVLFEMPRLAWMSYVGHPL
jgi:hypothetical protein